MSAASGGSGANLAQALKNLNNEWQQTLAFWHDTKAQEFEKHYLEPLPGHVTNTINVMEEISQLMKKIRSDCE